MWSFVSNPYEFQMKYPAATGMLKCATVSAILIYAIYGTGKAFIYIKQPQRNYFQGFPGFLGHKSYQYIRYKIRLTICSNSSNHLEFLDTACMLQSYIWIHKKKLYANS